MWIVVGVVVVVTVAMVVVASVTVVVVVKLGGTRIIVKGIIITVKVRIRYSWYVFM